MIIYFFKKLKHHLPVGVFNMSKNTYMDLFGNQEIYLIFVKYKTNKK